MSVRLMYKQSVVLCDPKKYTKSDDSTVFSAELEYFTYDGNVYVCETCDGALSRGKLLLQAKANSLKLSPIPPEISS